MLRFIVLTLPIVSQKVVKRDSFKIAKRAYAEISTIKLYQEVYAHHANPIIIDFIQF